MKAVSPTLAGGFFATEPPGKPSSSLCQQKLYVWYRGPSHSFVYNYLVAPAPLFEETILFPLNSLGTRAKNQLALDVGFISFLFHYSLT